MSPFWDHGKTNKTTKNFSGLAKASLADFSQRVLRLALLGQPEKSPDFFFTGGLRPPDPPSKKASGLRD